MSRQYRAGQSIEDACRQCHEDRMHTVIVVDGSLQPIRVRCDYCGSEHNYRGGPRDARPRPEPGGASRQPSQVAAHAAATPARSRGAETRGEAAPGSLVSPRERRFAPMTDHDRSTDLETLLRTIIREESGLTAVTPAEKWRGGDLVLRPGRPGLQEKTWPIETFFHKVVMLRNRLRTLEQQINASELPADQKVKLQSYITGCYGSLTSFNVLFADEDDRFVGEGKD